MSSMLTWLHSTVSRDYSSTEEHRSIKITVTGNQERADEAVLVGFEQKRLRSGAEKFAVSNRGAQRVFVEG
jgi:hypothetical protein